MAVRTKIARSLLGTALSSTKTQRFASGSWTRYGSEVHAGSLGSFWSSFSTSAAAAAAEPEEAHLGTTSSGVETRLFGMLKEYEDYRRALYGGLTHKALLVDAVGTLVVPSQPMAQVSKLIRSSVCP